MKFAASDRSCQIKRRHINIPIFIPHLGCPNQCVFCNQRTISGQDSFDVDSVEREIEECIASSAGCEREIAFFGGSFTGIDRSLMVRLLDMAQKYVDYGEVTSIRMSTRPDYISEDIIRILKRYTLSEVELGVQSMVPRVLNASKRGHTSEAVAAACSLLKNAGVPFVGQMMIGLPSSSPEDETYTAEKLCSLGISAARIYPTLVLKGTELSEMADYTPLTVEEAVSRSADVLEVLICHGVPCRRIGLCESELLHSESTAGPAHPAMGELVMGEVYLRRICAKMGKSRGRSVTVEVPAGRLSCAVGQRGRNREYLMRRFEMRDIRFAESTELFEYSVRVTVR